MSLGKKLRSLRQKAKKTMKEQGEMFGVKLNTVYRWEHDQARPDAQTLEKLADYYDAPLDWLLQENIIDSAIEQECGASYSANIIEQRILKILRKLPDNCRHRVLGYVEHVYMEIHDIR